MNEIVRGKPADMFYGQHRSDERLDTITLPERVHPGESPHSPAMYRFAARHLRDVPTGKVALYLEGSDVADGLSVWIQHFIDKGMIPSLAYVAATLVEAGADDTSRNFAYRLKIADGELDQFSKSELLIANRLHADFPNRVEIHSEEHAPEFLEAFESSMPELDMPVAKIMFAIGEGRVDEGADRLRVLATRVAKAQAKREMDVLDQMESILLRPDMVALTGYFGLDHSLGISKGLQRKGFAPHATFLFKNTSGEVLFDPFAKAMRQVKDREDRIPDMFWRYAAIEYAFFTYARGLRLSYDDAEARKQAVVVARECMQPLTDALTLRNFSTDLEEHGYGVILRRLSAVLGRDDIDSSVKHWTEIANEV